VNDSASDVLYWHSKKVIFWRKIPVCYNNRNDKHHTVNSQTPTKERLDRINVAQKTVVQILFLNELECRSLQTEAGAGWVGGECFLGTWRRGFLWI
jgi:hypothetical protein